LPTFAGCWSCMTVTGLTYDTANGSASLFPPGVSELGIALDPYNRGLDVPPAFYEMFMQISGGDNSSVPDVLTYPAKSPPKGNLTVTLQNGFQAVIPPDELFALPRLYNSTGYYSVSNDSYYLAEINNVTEPDYIYYSWGLPLLTMIYLTIDYEQNMVQLAEAYRGPNEGALVEKLCTGGPSPTTTTTIPTRTPTPTPTLTPTPTPPPAHNSNTGAIVGGVVGGVAGLAIVIALILVFFRLGKRKAEKESPIVEHKEEPYRERPAGTLSTYTDTTRTELELPSPGENHPVTKWLSTHDAVHEAGDGVSLKLLFISKKFAD